MRAVPRLRMLMEALEPRTLLSTVMVTSNADSGTGSLRAAIVSAVAGDTITFDSSLNNQTITLTSGQLLMNKSLDIEGPGAANLRISGGGASRIFYVGTSGNVTIAGLTITDGSASIGGGVDQNSGGLLMVNNCIFTNNHAVDNGSGAYGNGGAIEVASGSLNVSNCTFTANKAVGFSGGAINIATGAKAATITDSAFSANQVIGTLSGGANPGSVLGGAVCNASVTGAAMTVTGCRFTNNAAMASSSGNFAFGGALTALSTTTITNSTFTGNLASGGGGSAPKIGGAGSGAIAAANGGQPSFTMTIVGCTVSGNSAIGASGADGVNTFGFAAGGGIGNGMTMIVRDSTITNNVAMGGDLAPNANPPHNPSTALSLDSEGGGIDSGGPLTVIDTTISGNRAVGGAGSANYPGTDASGGGITVSNTVADTVSGCTIDDNTAVGGAAGTGTAGGNGFGGGIQVQVGASLTAVNTTVSRNQAIGTAGGMGIGGAIHVAAAVTVNIGPGTLKLTNSTIAANVDSGQTAHGGGIAVSGGQASMFNTIAAGNSDAASGAGSSPDDVNGAINPTSDYNLIAAGLITSTLNPGNHNEIGTAASPIDAKLGPLADNGGPTQTMALLPGSPAIDAGSNALAVDAGGHPLMTDQRDLPRISNGTVDIGAYELQQTLELLSTTVGDGTAQRSEVRSLTLRFNQPVTLSSGAVTLALLNTGGSGTNNGAAPNDVSAALATPTTSDGGFTWVFTFLASDSGTVDPTGSLRDGIYTATVHAAGVTGTTGQLTGGDQTVTFHRLFGDINGDGTVNNADYFQLNKAFNSKLGAAAYNAAFDFTGDGVINNTDYFRFNKNVGKTFTE